MPVLVLLLTLFFFCLPAYAEHPRILFDQGHGQVFVIEKNADLHLSALAQTFVDQGYEVSSTSHPLTEALLSQTDALIISGAFTPFSPDEINNIRRFIARGGRLAVMIHISPPVLPLLLDLGVDVANGVIHEKQQVLDNQPLNFKTSRLQAHRLTKGLDFFSLYGSWPVRPLKSTGQILAFSSNQSWVDLSRDQRQTPGDAVQAFGVLVENRIKQGKLLVFGDDALFQNRFLADNNQRLASNMGRWLTAGTTRSGQEI